MHQRKRRKKSPSIKPQKTRLDSFRRFLAKNQDIMTFAGIVIAAAALAFAVYFHLSSVQAKPQENPKLRLQIERPSSPVLDRSSPAKRAFNWGYPVEMHGGFYILVVQYVPM